MAIPPLSAARCVAIRDKRSRGATCRVTLEQPFHGVQRVQHLRRSGRRHLDALVLAEGDAYPLQVLDQDMNRGAFDLRSVAEQVWKHISSRSSICLGSVHTGFCLATSANQPSEARADQNGPSQPFLPTAPCDDRSKHHGWKRILQISVQILHVARLSELGVGGQGPLCNVSCRQRRHAFRLR